VFLKDCSIPLVRQVNVEVEVPLHAFLTSALDCEWSASRPGRFTSQQIPSYELGRRPHGVCSVLHHYTSYVQLCSSFCLLFCCSWVEGGGWRQIEIPSVACTYLVLKRQSMTHFYFDERSTEYLWNDVQNCVLGWVMMEAVRTSETSIDNHFTRHTCELFVQMVLRRISFSNIDQAHNGTRNTYYRTNGPHKKKYLLTRRHSQLLIRITFQNVNFVICIILNKRVDNVHLKYNPWTVQGGQCATVSATSSPPAGSFLSIFVLRFLRSPAVRPR
jgi:hypothetical protein